MKFRKLLKSVKKHTGDIIKAAFTSILVALILSYASFIPNHTNSSAQNAQHDAPLVTSPAENTQQPANNQQRMDACATNETLRNVEYQGDQQINKNEAIVLFGGCFSLGLIDIDYSHKATINFNLNKNIREVFVGDTVPFNLGSRNYQVVIKEVNLEYGYVKIDVYKL